MCVCVFVCLCVCMLYTYTYYNDVTFNDYVIGCIITQGYPRMSHDSYR